MGGVTISVYRQVYFVIDIYIEYCNNSTAAARPPALSHIRISAQIITFTRNYSEGNNDFIADRSKQLGRI